MAKTIYTAIVNGQEITRQTARTYSHAVVWASNCGHIVKSTSFCGSQVLAQKARNQLNDGTLIYSAEELNKIGLDPAAYEVLETNPKFHIVPGKWLIVPVAPKTK